MTEQNLLKLFDDLKFATSKVYDKAMDANYIETKIGGGNHRLFDGGHSIFEAWDNVKNARPDDSFLEEVVGFMKAKSCEDRPVRDANTFISLAKVLAAKFKLDILYII